MNGIVPSDGRFQAGFSTARVSTNYLARYYLRALEKQAQGKSEPELVPNPNEEVVNLEDIFPDNPGPGWSHVDNDVAAAYHKRICKLALLKTKINVDAGNDGFGDKKSHYASSDFGSLPSWLSTTNGGRTK